MGGKVVSLTPGARVPRGMAAAVDIHVGAKLRERRIALGLSQQALAELLGITYQQAHKYERGINRVTAGRLLQLGQALGVEVGYFFEGISGGAPVFRPP